MEIDADFSPFASANNLFVYFASPLLDPAIPEKLVLLHTSALPPGSILHFSFAFLPVWMRKDNEGNKLNHKK
jgi:hypothetical protein